MNHIAPLKQCANAPSVSAPVRKRYRAGFRNNLRRTAFMLTMFGALAASAGAQTVRLACDFTGTDPARNLPWRKTTVREAAIGVTGWKFGAGVDLTSPQSDCLAFSVNASSALTTLGDAKSQQTYLSLVIYPVSAPLNLAANRITFTIRRMNWHAPLGYAVFGSVDGFAAPLFQSHVLANATTATDTFTFLLPQSGYSSIAKPVEFRIYPFAARYSGHPAALTAFTILPAVKTYTVTAGKTGSGTVQVTPSRTLFAAGETAQFSAAPAAGYKFAGWTGSLPSRANPLVIAVTANLSLTANFVPKPAPNMQMGGNLEALTDWSRSWVFKDCFKQARTWMTRNADGSGNWDSGKKPLTNADGWPLAVPFSPGTGQSAQILHTLLPLYSAGAYTVRFQGTGTIYLMPPQGGVRVSISGAGGTTARSLTFKPILADNMLYLEVRKSSSLDPVRNIQVIAPGQDSNLATQPFHPAFLSSLAPYRNLRFMDWLQTNFSTVDTWAKRTTARSYTQARPEGGAHEYAIALANVAQKDAWICIPHMANDDYVRQTARLYRDTLSPLLKLFVEYSNETWNGGFTQTSYVQQRGAALGLDTNAWQAGQKFVSRRSAEIFAIFEQEFGAANRQRLVNVLATQAAGAEGVTSVRVAAINNPKINTARKYPDALAIAPYFGVNYTTTMLNPMPTADQIVTTISAAEIARAKTWTLAHSVIADRQGWRLVCYEGGQHFLGIEGAGNNSTLVYVLFRANRDTRMQDRYREYLKALRGAGADLFVNFAHIGEWSKWGTWGALEYQQQPDTAAPKWRAIKAWLAQ